MAVSKPHPKNVPGDFYVKDGCCTMCEVPLIEAPDMFGGFGVAEDESHCYVKRQPNTSSELDRLIMTIRCAELECIHYRGNDPTILSRLVEVDEMSICDHLPAELNQREIEQQAERSRRWNDRKASNRMSLWHRLRGWWRGSAR